MVKGTQHPTRMYNGHQPLKRLNTLTESLSDSYGIDVPDIGGLDDVIDAMDMCEEYNVPYDGLEDIDDIQERLRLHFIKEKRAVSLLPSRKIEIQNAIIQAGEEDVRKRKKLAAIMEDLLLMLRRDEEDTPGCRNSQVLGELLKTEGTSDNLVDDCLTRIENAKDTECLVLVAGETSAGKSSVLNLLFEEDILPVHTKSSTSVITIIRYDKRKWARVVYKLGEKDREFDLDAEGMEQLSAIAFMESASERENHNIKEVQVYLPLPLLKSGLVLVDTPGIGENEFLETELMNFIGQNQIMGFVYIIKTDNAGGVQEDRLLNLLKLVVYKQRSASLGNTSDCRFHPKSALFVCNRWDLVKTAEQNKVRQYAIQKLAACWPSFDESQVVFFSTGKAARDIEADADYINDNYKIFLESLRDLFITALERRIKLYYKWIENVLKRTVHHLKAVVRRLDYSDKELLEKSESAKSKLACLREKSDRVVETMNDLLDSESRVLCDKLREYAKSAACKFKLTRGWSLDELPNVTSGLGDWSWLKTRLHEAFYMRLTESVVEWDKDEGALDTMEKEMSTTVKFELQLLETELAEIEKEIQGDSSSDSSDELSSLCKSRRSSIVPTSLKGVYLLTESKLPLKLAGRIVSPIKSLFDSLRNTAKVSDYKNNPIKVAEMVAKDMYACLVSKSDGDGIGFMPFVEYLLERPKEYILALERKIPFLILSNQLLVNHFQQSIKEERRFQKEYEEMMTKSESLRRSLMIYGEGYIFVNDFMKGEIQLPQHHTDDGAKVSVAFMASTIALLDSQESEQKQRHAIQGLWNVTYTGVLCRSDTERSIQIRMYLPSSGVNNTFREVAKLRCLNYRGTSVCEFLGIYHVDTPTAALVYDGCLKSVRRCLHSFFSRRECVPPIIKDTAAALLYLHSKGLVHMELSQDTVTVDENGDVKITGACVPRHATFPRDCDATDTGNFVYLAPEVLQGGVYDVYADVYAFGLMVLELVQVDIQGYAFKSQRKMNLSDFIKGVNPGEMLDLERNVQVFTNKTRAMIQNCLDVHSYRPDMSQVVEYAEFVGQEKEALNRLPTRRSHHPVIRRKSSSSVVVAL